MDQIFDFLVSDFSRCALELYSKPACPAPQMEHSLKMVRKPAFDASRYDRVWKAVHALKDAYEMSP